MDKLGYSNIFQESMEHLLKAEKQLHSKIIDQSEDVTKYETIKNFDSIWAEIDSICKKLSYECTKLCICFCNSPKPTSVETSALLQVIEGTVLLLVNNIYKLNSSGGKTFYEEAIASSISAVQSARQLLRAIKEEKGEGISERYRQATGIAWEGCKRLEQCPRNNKEAVLAQLKNQNSLICDAYNEISSEMEGDGGGWSQHFLDISNEAEVEGSRWSEKDKEFMAPGVNLIKATKMWYKRIITAIETNGCNKESKEVEELDQILEDCKPVSQTVDSLILDLYPPLNIDHVKKRSEELVTQVASAVKSATQSHVITEEEQAHMEFVSRALNHNYDKIRDFFKDL